MRRTTKFAFIILCSLSVDSYAGPIQDATNEARKKIADELMLPSRPKPPISMPKKVPGNDALGNQEIDHKVWRKCVDNFFESVPQELVYTPAFEGILNTEIKSPPPKPCEIFSLEEHHHNNNVKPKILDFNQIQLSTRLPPSQPSTSARNKINLDFSWH